MVNTTRSSARGGNTSRSSSARGRGLPPRSAGVPRRRAVVRASTLEDRLEQFMASQQQMVGELSSRLESLETAPVNVTAAGPEETTSVEEHLAADIAGEREPNQLDDHVAGAVRQKIESELFVEFAGLLPERAVQGDAALRTLSVSVNGEISVVPKEHVGSKSLSFEQWLQAWFVFSTAYLRKFPLAAVPLLKYSEAIRSMAQKGTDWARYDLMFRKARGNYPRQYRWEVLNTELFLQSQQLRAPRGVSSPFRQAEQKSGGGFIPVGFCRKFHSRGLFCPAKSGECRFKHVCPTCQGEHVWYLCPGKSVVAGRPTVTPKFRPSNSATPGRSSK